MAWAYEFRIVFGMGLTLAPTGYGIGGEILSGHIGAFLLGVTFTVACLGILTPTENNIRRQQRRLAASGCSQSLADALNE
jgi:hypothetical protein